MTLKSEGKIIATNAEGFLINRNDWSKEVSALIAEKHGMQLTQMHLDILLIARDNFTEKKYTMSMRRFIPLLNKKLNTDSIDSLYLMQLFGSSPAKMIAKLAGLSKPKNCL